ncbi:hypothetical protein E2493_12925 [Sphingomonas parva]|uniref:histidine kinase n=1 Tax=Sphingomonas parva TaxID=2555898 RepID=A0A4Y8ZRY4_9SPHN|nr:PAS domain-containing sensor histidine kinase [Sphingomonas parva]TFI57885.1 hypothetical protein E2493_12925 [Sphingomonas parva]
MPDQMALDAALRKLKEHGPLSAEAERVAGTGVYIYDAAAGQAIWSREVRRIYGLPEDQERLPLEAGLARIHPDDLPAFLETVRTSVATGEPCALEHRVVRPDGEVRYVHARGEIVCIEGYENPVLAGTVRDVTERYEWQSLVLEQDAQLRAMKAELLFHSRQSAMGTMAATMAHELNQPLTAITFILAALERTDPARLGEREVREMLTMAKENALRAGQIIQRLRHGIVAHRPAAERFTCSQLINEAIRFSSIGCEGVRFVLDVGNNVVESADRVQIQQVLVNLIRNACQAASGRPDAQVRITSRRSPDDPRMLRISVSDNGPGIAEEILPNVFTRGVTTKEHGMGLGLPICKTIIEAHGGHIWARNGAEGACLSFEIPLAPLPEGSAEPV